MREIRPNDSTEASACKKTILSAVKISVMDKMYVECGMWRVEGGMLNRLNSRAIADKMYP